MGEMDMKQITVQEFVQAWRDGYISDIVVLRDRVYGRSVKGQAGTPRGHEIVYADIPATLPGVEVAAAAEAPAEGKKPLWRRILHL